MRAGEERRAEEAVGKPPPRAGDGVAAPAPPAADEPELSLRTSRLALVRTALVALLVLGALVALLLMVFDRPGGSPAARSVLGAPAMAALAEGYRRALQAEDHEAAVVLFQRMTALGHPAARRRGEQLAYRSSLRGMIARRRARLAALARAGACAPARQQQALLRALRSTLPDPDPPDAALDALVAGCRPAAASQPARVAE